MILREFSLYALIRHYTALYEQICLQARTGLCIDYTDGGVTFFKLSIPLASC